MKCEVCNIRCPEDGATMYRVNPLGELPAVWRCWEHLSAEQRAAVDPESKEIISILEDDARQQSGHTTEIVEVDGEKFVQHNLIHPDVLKHLIPKP